MSERAEGERGRDEHVARGEPGAVGAGEEVAGARDAGGGFGEQAPMQSPDQPAEHDQPEERMQMGSEGVAAEERVVRCEKEARERPEEAEGQIVLRQPGQVADLLHPLGVRDRATDEVVELVGGGPVVGGAPSRAIR